VRWHHAVARSAGLLAIVAVAAIFGYGNVVVRQAEAVVPATLLIAMRYLGGSLVLLPVLIGRGLQWRFLGAALLVGGALGLGTVAQAWSMLTIPLTEMAFVSALFVVITPLAVAISARRAPPWRVWAAVGGSLAGVALVLGRLAWHPGVGVWWGLVAAVALTAQIVGTARLARSVPPPALAAAQMAGAGAFLTAVALLQGEAIGPGLLALGRWPLGIWADIAYLALGASVVAFWLQTWAQARVSSTVAALGFNLEPAFTGATAWLVLGQSLTAWQLVGSVLALGALMWGASARPADDDARRPA
jgi:drug/metabolite transporter (DMT)-like permease